MSWDDETCPDCGQSVHYHDAGRCADAKARTESGVLMSDPLEGLLDINVRTTAGEWTSTPATVGYLTVDKLRSAMESTYRRSWEPQGIVLHPKTYRRLEFAYETAKQSVMWQRVGDGIFPSLLKLGRKYRKIRYRIKEMWDNHRETS